MKESTRIMFKKHGWRVDRAIHNYIYFAFYYPYVKIVQLFLILLKHLTWIKPLQYVGDMAFNRYHGKFMSLEDTEKIFTLDEDISAVSSANKRIIPRKYAFKILFQEPDYIAVMDCPCKKAYGAAPEFINSCLAVGKGVASFWLEHGEKYHAHRITQAEALDLIRRFRKQGHITQAFFKVATGGSSGVICNCHPDTCVSLKASSITRHIRPDLSQSIESGYSVKHAEQKCTLCGTCVQSCHFGAVKISDGLWSYDAKTCLGCGLCVESCPNETLSLYVDAGKARPLDMDDVRENLATT
ncbi:MAG: 4Fe-4S binding protein [Syntrophaceae bacterium]